MSPPKMLPKNVINKNDAEANSSKEDARYVQVFFVAQLTPSKLSSRTNFLRLKLT